MFFNAAAGNLKNPSIKVGSEGLILLQYRSLWPRRLSDFFF